MLVYYVNVITWNARCLLAITGCVEFFRAPPSKVILTDGLGSMKYFLTGLWIDRQSCVEHKLTMMTVYMTKLFTW